MNVSEFKIALDAVPAARQNEFIYIENHADGTISLVQGLDLSLVGMVVVVGHVAGTKTVSGLLADVNAIVAVRGQDRAMLLDGDDASLDNIENVDVSTPRVIMINAL